jgi:glycosyltransferase involved in cell wall biosynthesis
MRVLVIAHPDPYTSGGTKRSYEVLRRMNKYGVEPTVVVDENFASNYDVLDGLVHYLVVRHSISRFFGGLFYPLKSLVAIVHDPVDVMKVLKDSAFDLVVSHHEFPHFVLPAYTIAKRLGLPWTAVLQLPLNPFRQTLSGSIEKNPLWFLIQLMTLKALTKTSVLTVSSSLMREMKPMDHVLLNPGIGVDHEIIASCKPLEESYECVFFARLVPEKGVFDALKIWYYVKEKMDNAKLAVMGRFGTNSVRHNFFRLVRRLGLRDNVNYLGFLPQREQIAYVKSSKVLLYPSRIDSLSLTVLESLACGLPVVAYDIPAITMNYKVDSVIKVPKGNIKLAAYEVVRLLQNELFRRNLSRLATEFSKKYTWEAVTEAEVNAYKRLLTYASQKTTSDRVERMFQN